MKIKYFPAIALAGTITFAVAPVLAESVAPVFEESSDAPQFNFSCQLVEGVPTTLAKAVDSKANQPVFHWKSDALALKSSATPQQLCDGVSNKLEEYSASGYDLSQLSFVGTEQEGIPVICANTAGGLGCSKVLVTLRAAENPANVASDVVDSILDKNLQSKVSKFNDRGVQSTSYQVDFWSLLGLNLKFMGK